MKDLSLICVPITETQATHFLSAIAEAAPIADLIELRLDYLDDGERKRVLTTLSERAGANRPPLLFTFRPQEQGGQRALSLDERRAFWQSLPAAVTAVISLADFELDLVESFAHESPPLPWEKVICSWHNFDETPADLLARYQRTASTPAAIVKIATKANRMGDCLRIFDLLDHAQNAKPVIALGMGLPGLATRVLALSRGALLTFGALRRGAESASGQPTATELRELYRARLLTRASEIYGVIGNPIGHSRSPLLHNAALKASGRDGVYLPFEVDDAREFLRDFVRPATKKLDWNLRGLSVTIPHKLAVMSQLDALDATAQAVGAVNTIVVEGARLIGYNTDVAGAMQPLAEQFELQGARVAVLGAGGAARAVCYGLRQHRAEVTIYARDLGKAQSLAQEFNARSDSLARFAGQCDVVINCTPIGMKGFGENQSPVKPESLQGVKLVYDLVYNPQATQLLDDARQAGCRTLGGLTMLVAQAAEQFRLWTGEAPPRGLMWRAAL